MTATQATKPGKDRDPAELFEWSALVQECSKSPHLQFIDLSNATIPVIRELLNLNNALTMSKIPILLGKYIIRMALIYVKGYMPEALREHLTPEKIRVSVESDELQILLKKKVKSEPSLMMMVLKNILSATIGSSLDTLSALLAEKPLHADGPNAQPTAFATKPYVVTERREVPRKSPPPAPAIFSDAFSTKQSAAESSSRPQTPRKRPHSPDYRQPPQSPQFRQPAQQSPQCRLPSQQSPQYRHPSQQSPHYRQPSQSPQYRQPSPSPHYRQPSPSPNYYRQPSPAPSQGFMSPQRRTTSAPRTPTPQSWQQAPESNGEVTTFVRQISNLMAEAEQEFGQPSATPQRQPSPSVMVLEDIQIQPPYTDEQQQQQPIDDGTYEYEDSAEPESGDVAVEADDPSQGCYRNELDYDAAPAEQSAEPVPEPDGQDDGGYYGEGGVYDEGDADANPMERPPSVENSLPRADEYVDYRAGDMAIPVADVVQPEPDLEPQLEPEPEPEPIDPTQRHLLANYLPNDESYYDDANANGYEASNDYDDYDDEGGAAAVSYDDGVLPGQLEDERRTPPQTASTVLQRQPSVTISQSRIKPNAPDFEALLATERRPSMVMLPAEPPQPTPVAVSPEPEPIDRSRPPSLMGDIVSNGVVIASAPVSSSISTSSSSSSSSKSKHRKRQHGERMKHAPAPPSPAAAPPAATPVLDDRIVIDDDDDDIYVAADSSGIGGNQNYGQYAPASRYSPNEPRPVAATATMPAPSRKRKKHSHKSQPTTPLTY
jgi:hypothetical protein